MAVITFALSAALVAMACVKASRVRAWRHTVNPPAPEVPDSAFTVTRIMLFAVAAADWVLECSPESNPCHVLPCGLAMSSAEL
jgi:hypothetical protein